MSKEVQLLFSKDGKKGKRAFTQTRLFKCLIGEFAHSVYIIFASKIYNSENKLLFVKINERSFLIALITRVD